MSFNYIRKPATIEAYSKTFELPVKTIQFIEQIEATMEIPEKATTRQTVEIALKGIALFITPQETKLIFPSVDDVIPNEVYAFYKALVNAQSEATQNIIKNEYSPAEIVRKPIQ